MKKSRYSWKEKPDNYKASYFNEEDYKEGKTFTVVDNLTGKNYPFPKKNSSDNKYFIIPSKLCNDEFIAWAICTTEDIIKQDGCIGYIEDLDSTFDYVVKNFEFPEIFKYINKNWIKPSAWEFAFKRNKEVARYVPKNPTKKMLDAICTLKNVERIPFDDSYLTSEMFEKIYFNCDKEHRPKLISSMVGWYPSQRKRLAELLNQKIVDDILSIKIDAIIVVPKNLVTEKYAEKAMLKNPMFIRYIPAKYQTLEYQRMVVENDVNDYTLINKEVLEEEIIYYVLSKKEFALSNISKDKRTKEICEFAVDCFGTSLRYVPKELKSRELCLKAVKKAPKVIKHVPKEMIDNEFIEELTKVCNEFEPEDIDYINECISMYRVDETDINDIKEQVFVEPAELSEKYSQLGTKYFDCLFSSHTINVMRMHGIFSLGGLISESRKPSTMSSIMNSSKTVYNEILVALKYLNCLYLGYNPNITFDENKPIKETLEEFGFTKKARSIIENKCSTTKAFYDLIKSDNIAKELIDPENVDKKSIREIIYKVSIVLNYYENIQNREDIVAENEEIKLYNEELEKINIETNMLKQRISDLDERAEEIQEILREKDKQRIRMIHKN